MTDSAFPHLFSALDLGPVRLRNRIVSTGHHTHLTEEQPNDALVAYHEARAKGGAGLIITEVVGVHETALFSNDTLMALDSSCIAPFRRLSDAIHSHGTQVFAQLFHPGREILSSTNGLLPAAYAPSAVPNERFHIMPRPMSDLLIRKIIQGYGRAAGFLAEAGYDGVEIVANQGYLPAQFLNPRVNLRDDDWGGDDARRLAFLLGVIESVRAAAPDLALGLRISGDELDGSGLTEDEVLPICRAVAERLDYFSVVAGSSAGLGASVHIVPPMGIEAAYTAPYAAKIRQATGKAVIATGRINQPQVAEQVIASGAADLCGMTRALIADAEMSNKALEGEAESIRACIACNQSCIGRAHKGLGISCIQNPMSGRESELSPAPSATGRIVVVGGGPGGMKAAVTAAERGYQVTLFEAARHLGGQTLLAQRLPGREEFGGMVTNLESELARAGVKVENGVQADASLLAKEKVDAVILATGAKPFRPPFEGSDLAHVVTAWDVIEGSAKVGGSVVIADWRSDWVGLGLAEQLARNGSQVILCSNAQMAGETLQLYTRNHYVGRLRALGVQIRTHLRLFGVDEDTAYFQDTLTQEAVPIEGIETLVLALGHDAVDAIDPADLSCPVHRIGDCLAPRTAEEAIYEGYMVGRSI